MRECRIDHLADAIVEAALVEAMALRVGPNSVMEALNRAYWVLDSIGKIQGTGLSGATRMNELRAWLGMVPVPDAKATEP